MLVRGKLNVALVKVILKGEQLDKRVKKNGVLLHFGLLPDKDKVTASDSYTSNKLRKLLLAWLPNTFEFKATIYLQTQAGFLLRVNYSVCHLHAVHIT